MNRYYGNVVLVTGASSGIGKAVAEYLAKEGYRVYGTSRKQQPTGGSAAGSDSGIPGEPGFGRDSGGFVRMLRMDVCSEESVRQAVEQVLAAEGEIGILVNNAGMGMAGSVEDTSPEEAYLQFNTNFFGMHRVIRQVLPGMRKRGRGLIVNMSSVGAVFPIPYQSMYVPTKAAVEGMSGALRNELRPFGIKVSMVEPGDTKTGFTDSRTPVKALGAGSVYEELCRKSVAVMEHDERNGPDPIVVAKVVGRTLERKNPPPVVTVGLQYKVLIFLKRFLPQRLVSFVVGKMYEGK